MIFQRIPLFFSLGTIWTFIPWYIRIHKIYTYISWYYIDNIFVILARICSEVTLDARVHKNTYSNNNITLHVRLAKGSYTRKGEKYLFTSSRGEKYANTWKVQSAYYYYMLLLLLCISIIIITIQYNVYKYILYCRRFDLQRYSNMLTPRGVNIQPYAVTFLIGRRISHN